MTDVAFATGAPSVYISGAFDRTMAPPLIEKFAAVFSTSRTWQAGHSSYLSHIEDVAELIISIRRNPEAARSE